MSPYYEEPRVKKPSRIEPRITKGNLYTIGVILAAFVGNVSWTHFKPSEGTVQATRTAQVAVDNTVAIEAKAIVLERTVEDHTKKFDELATAVDKLSTDVAVIKTQNEIATRNSDKINEKLDELLKIVYREQGRSNKSSP